MVGEHDTTVADAGTSVESNTVDTKHRVVCLAESVADDTEGVAEEVEDVTVGREEVESVEDDQI